MSTCARICAICSHGLTHTMRHKVPSTLSNTLVATVCSTLTLLRQKFGIISLVVRHRYNQSMNLQEKKNSAIDTLCRSHSWAGQAHAIHNALGPLCILSFHQSS